MRPLDPYALPKLIEAVEAVVVAYDGGHTLSGYMERLSNQLHLAMGEKPCFKCNRWHRREHSLCENCDPETWEAA